MQGMGWGGETPAIVVAAECGGGAIAEIGAVEGGADFVEGIPAPGEIDFGVYALPGDTRDQNKLALGGEDGDAFLLRLAGRD